MANEKRTEGRFIYMDVSRSASPLEFVERLQEVSNKHLDLGKRTASRFKQVWGKLSGGEVGGDVFSLKIPHGFAANWKTLLESLLHDLNALEGRTTLAFDELPLMLDSIKRNTAGGEAIVIEILDTLRAARQTETELRMIYTGSLGLHHILTVLRDGGYQNDPTNDMTTIAVEPLAPTDATELARRLLLGERVPCVNLDVSAEHLAKVTDGMAFYIQHVVDGIAISGDAGNEADIDRHLSNRIDDARDLWHLRYYDERIGTHYPEPLRNTARAILDHLAFVDSSCPFDELCDTLDPKTADRSQETVRAALRLLGMDNYLVKREEGYQFRYPFIARVWQIIRK